MRSNITKNISANDLLDILLNILLISLWWSGHS